MPTELGHRMLADAARVQPIAPARPRLWAHLTGLIGGWQGMGGLVAACAAGVWLGLSPPADWADPMQIVSPTTSSLDGWGGDTLAYALAEEES